MNLGISLGDCVPVLTVLALPLTILSLPNGKTCHHRVLTRLALLHILEYSAKLFTGTGLTTLRPYLSCAQNRQLAEH
jgi:hypothetical protein